MRRAQFIIEGGGVKKVLVTCDVCGVELAENEKFIRWGWQKHFGGDVELVYSMVKGVEFDVCDDCHERALKFFSGGER